MSWRDDLSRLIDTKSRQVRSCRTQAAEKQSAAQSGEQQAAQLRDDSAQVLAGAVPMQEHGMTRQSLYERLRLIALARAHAIESLQHAITLENQASQARQAASELTHEAQRHERKQRKIEHWKKLQERALRLRKARRTDHDIQEMHACRSHR